MKKLFVFIIVAMFFAGVSSVYAEEYISSCGDGHGVYDNTGRHIVSCISAEDWNKTKISPSQEGMINVPKGRDLMTSFGIKDYCPNWYIMDCVILQELFSYFLN